ncbi:lycopene cyclase domain-containing protein [Corallococcus interemptor]|uniref:lycopene cyclase domain-containing protein n=1 Tax=Corallococcus TaxID=83461 RepID=UPI001CC18810|nr:MULTISPECIES: lycopene cyclase domain-containing protein [unclassified Corallococcus]MBZ4336249.1 lycopene cyclase domain-containing protein [Corallococcus sp. AS-1-12]MBZ4375815.1 lycopene cyclase domain-containing protein [Corallococcus sp. AS-1-6]
MMETRWAYLIHLLGWTLPVIAIQLVALVMHYKARSGEVLRAVLPPALVVGVYLSIADHLAISTGIWNFGEGRHVGVYVGAVPLEEILFFLITSVLVSLGLALFTALLRLREARAS